MYTLSITMLLIHACIAELQAINGIYDLEYNQNMGVSVEQTVKRRGLDININMCGNQGLEALY